MKRFFRIAVACISFLSTVFLIPVNAQKIYNEHNVTQDVITEHYDNPVPLRVMEYSTDPAGTIIERRLEILPENNLPSVLVRSINQNFEEIQFVNQPPFDLEFDNGLFGDEYSIDAATLLFGTEQALKVIKDKFGWVGIDNNAFNGKPVIWNILAPANPSYIAAVQYSPVSKEFSFPTTGIEDKINHIDVIAHELTHAIIDFKVGSASVQDISPCSERRVLSEAICDIIGLYVLNEYEQNSPALFKWTLGKSVLWDGRPFDNPNIAEMPNTYYGNYYAINCPDDGSFPEHQNATVIDHWYYLLANGTIGTEANDLGYSYKFNGIGVDKAVQIVWNCIDYLDKYTDFDDLKKASLTVTQKLYGLHSPEYLAVMDAWCAVGICDNNLGVFSMSPAHGTIGVNAWPGVDVGFTWEGKPVQEWELQFSSAVDFTLDVQSVLVKNFSVVINPNGGSAYSGFAKGYYRPGQTVYARARITKADVNFCKGYNPLCVLYQQFGPAHAFLLDDKKARFWHAVPGDTWNVSAWNDPDVEWKSVSGADQYRLQVSTDDVFSNLVYNAAIPHNGNFFQSEIIKAQLQTGKTYYTRVRAEKVNSPNVTENFGAWSDTELIKTNVPQTYVWQAVNQQPNDPATLVSSLGRSVAWDPVPGATHFVVQAATDNAFNNVVQSKTVAGNTTSTDFLFPAVADHTALFIRVLPQKGAAFGICTNVWRVETDENAVLPLMKSPAAQTSFPFKNFLGGGFQCKAGAVNFNLVDRFEFELTETSSGLPAIFSTASKAFDIFVQDPSLFDDKQGFNVRVRAVNPLGAKTGWSPSFHYNICPDHPAVTFPGDLGKVDPTLDFNIEWHPSFWFDAGSQFLVTIKQGGIAVPGFSDKPTTATTMLVPAGTLASGKSYTVTVRNSSSCPALQLPETFFNAVGSGGSNQPQTPKLVNFTIELKASRNDPDATVFPPEFGTSNYVLGLEFFDPNGATLALVNAIDQQVTQLEVDSENSGVVLFGENKPQGKYKLRLKLKDIYPPLTYYPFDQPWFSVSLNGQVVVAKHVITADFVNPASPFNEWQAGFQFADIELDIK